MQRITVYVYVSSEGLDSDGSQPECRHALNSRQGLRLAQIRQSPGEDCLIEMCGEGRHDSTSCQWLNLPRALLQQQTSGGVACEEASYLLWTQHAASADHSQMRVRMCRCLWPMTTGLPHPHPSLARTEKRERVQKDSVTNHLFLGACCLH